MYLEEIYLSKTSAAKPPEDPPDTAKEAAFGIDLRQEWYTFSPMI